jgi:prepilin-type processing-associated H-X9-DG protein
MSINPENDPEFRDVLPKKSVKRRFSLVRVLVALGIVLFAMALLLPATRSARPAARRAWCTNNLKQIARALHGYEQEHGALPPACTLDANGRPLHSWRTLILPYLEEEQLYKTIDLSKPWNDPANAKALEVVPFVFRCPEASGAPSATTYLAIVSPNGCLIRGKGRRLSEITDSHASTFMVIESDEEHAVPWMAPIDADEALVLNLGPGSKLHHAGGVNASLVDGSVAFLKASTPAEVRRALISISGNDDKAAAEW